MPKDFFGNEIEVGDEVAYLMYSNPELGDITTITEDNEIYVGKRYLGQGDKAHDHIFLNVEKKHREKALEYLAKEENIEDSV